MTPKGFRNGIKIDVKRIKHAYNNCIKKDKHILGEHGFPEVPDYAKVEYGVSHDDSANGKTATNSSNNITSSMEKSMKKQCEFDARKKTMRKQCETGARLNGTEKETNDEKEEDPNSLEIKSFKKISPGRIETAKARQVQ